MMWFRRKHPPRATGLHTLAGLTVGQVVRHKVTGAKAVVVRFDVDDEDGTIGPIVSIGWYSSDEFSTTAAEIEPWKEPVAVDAVAKGDTVL